MHWIIFYACVDFCVYRRFHHLIRIEKVKHRHKRRVRLRQTAKKISRGLLISEYSGYVRDSEFTERKAECVEAGERHLKRPTQRMKRIGKNFP